MLSDFKNITFIILLIVTPVLAHAQLITEPKVEANSHVQSMMIKSIELSDEYTIVNNDAINHIFNIIAFVGVLNVFN